MKYITYIMQSSSSGKYYVGSTGDLEQRIKEHNSGKTRSTRKRGPWQIVYSEELPSKKEAVRREYKIKSYKSGKAFKKLLESSY